MKTTKRILEGSQVSYRAVEENGKNYLEGYASVFNQRSKLIYENGKYFYEVIAPEAFDEALRESSDVKLNFNHENDKILARTKNGTLELSIDEKGLKFRAELPDVTYARDIWNLVKVQTLFENSFAFIVRKGDDEWSKDEQGNLIRLIRKVAKLIDVSVVVDGAYSNTTISARDLNLERAKTITITFNDDDEDEEDKPEEPEIPLEEEPKVEEEKNEEEEKEEVEKIEPQSENNEQIEENSLKLTEIDIENIRARALKLISK